MLFRKMTPDYPNHHLIMTITTHLKAALAASLLVATAALANPNLSPYGLTDGGASHHGAMNLSGNPAAPASIRWEYDSEANANNRSFDSGFALGVGRFGGGVNYGEVDEIFTEADGVYDTLENNDSISSTDLANITTDTENVLRSLQEDGYVNANVYGSVLPLEIASQKLAGVWSIHPHINLSTNTRFSGTSVDCKSVFDSGFSNCSDYLNGSTDLTNMDDCSRYILGIDGYDNLTVCQDALDDLESGDLSDACNAAIQGDDSNSVEDECSDIFDLNSDATMHLNIGLFTTIGVGYSTKVYEDSTGSIFLGLRGEYIGSNLYTTKITYTEIVEDYDNDVENISDDIQDDYEANAITDSGFAIDLGALWTTRYVRLGVSMDNAIAPKFAYKDDDGADQSFELPQQTRVEASLYPEGRWMHLSYVQDLDEAEAFSGEKTQWRTLSLGFTPYWAFLHARVGSSEEQVSGISYLTGGVSLFSVVHVDVGISTDEVTIDEDEQPRGFYIAGSVEFIF